MNFSIVIPGICKAKCPFCIQETRVKESKKYIEMLGVSLGWLIKRADTDFDTLEINITGGEPTDYLGINDVLAELKKRKQFFHKIVMTTNGSRLMKHPEILKTVDHLNISRHHYDERVRRNIFGIDTITDDQVKELVGLVKSGKCQTKDITFVSVVTQDLYNDADFYSKFIEYCGKMGVKCAFRKDYNMKNWQIWGTANYYAENNPVIRIGECPVCRQIEMIVEGVNVTWKFSHKRPVEVIPDYEIVFQPNGVAYHDWDLEFPVDTRISNFSYRNTVRTEDIRSSCVSHPYNGCI